MLLTIIRRALMALGAGVLVLALVAAYMARPAALAKHSILHLELDGPIPEAPEVAVGRLFGRPDSLPLIDIVARVRAAADDARIDGLMLNVRSPEVGLAQLEELGRAIKLFRSRGKWTGSFLETAGEGARGDGAYALATLAEHVVLAPPGEVNLHGMRTDIPFFAETLERVHVHAHVEQRYEYKNYADTFNQRGFTPAHKESLMSLLGDMQARLDELVADNRASTPTQVARWVLDAPHTAEEARSKHLVDKVGYWDEAQAMAQAVAGRPEPFISIADYTPPKPRGSGVPIALVVGEGEISRGEGARRPGRKAQMGSDTYTEALRQARADGVRGVLLRIDSPGGSYVASDLIRREVQLTRDANIPVVVSMGNVAASGGYFMAIDADHIVVEAGSITGSIGVVAAMFAVRDAAKTFAGVNFGTYEVLPHPGVLSFLDPPSPEGAARLKLDVDRIYADFVGKVARARHQSYEDIHKVARGRVWTGRQAVARGLADELGGMDTALDYLRRRLALAEGEELALTHYPEPETPWSYVRELMDGGQVAITSLQDVRAALAPLWGQLRAPKQGMRAESAVPAPAL